MNNAVSTMPRAMRMTVAVISQNRLQAISAERWTLNQRLWKSCKAVGGMPPSAAIARWRQARPVLADADPYGQTVGRHRGDDNLGDIIQPYDVGSRVEDFKDGVDLPPFSISRLLVWSGPPQP